MLVQSRFPWREMIIRLWPMTLMVTIYSSVISWIDANYHLERYQLPIAVGTLPGAFVGILLAFRTNSSYARWWEARILWGSIVNDSRTWVRQLIAFTANGDSSNATISKMAHRQIAWCHALTRSLRRQDPLSDLEDLVDEAELAALRRHNNVPCGLLLRQAEDLSRMHDEGLIDTWRFVTLEGTLTRLTDSMGGCERIRNTPFPPHYRTWVHYLIYLFIFMLPFTFVDTPALVMIVVTVPLAVGFIVVDRVAMYLESPFAEPLTGTPMTAITRTIEINIRQMLAESETPPEIDPVHGVLY